MSIEWIVPADRQQQNGMATKAARVLMRSGQAYRLAEVIVGIDADPADAVTANLQALWAAGRVVDVKWWLAAQERQFREYYENIMLACEQARFAGGNIDQIIAAGLSAVAAHDGKLAVFNDWRSKVGLLPEQVVSTGDKRDLLNLILTWAAAGKLAGLPG